jgi:hypothetical protein
MFGAGEQDIQMPPAAIWMHLTYQSAFVDDAGKLLVRQRTGLVNAFGRTWRSSGSLRRRGCAMSAG